jgi:CubicO group peptidase (beta-lactamase class C family)
MADVLPTLPQLSPVGTQVSYNNTGPVVVAQIIESVTGMPYRQAMDQLVLKPLRLTSASFDPEVTSAAPHSLGYGSDEAGQTVEVTPLFVPRNVEAAGGLWANVEDQMTYMRFHMGDVAFKDSTVLRPETRRLMQIGTRTFADPPGARIGLQWLLWDVNGYPSVQHGGTTFAHRSNMVFFPDRQIGMVILTNSQNASPVIEAAEAALIGQFMSPSPAPKPVEVKRSESELTEYTGRYATPSNSITLALSEGHLSMTHEDHPLPGEVRPSNDFLTLAPAPAFFIDRDRAMLGTPSEAGSSFAFVRRDDGSIGWLSLGGRLYPKVN